MVTKGPFGRILDKYAVPGGLGDAFGDCSAIDILSLTGQKPGYSQVLDDAPRFGFSKKVAFRKRKSKKLCHTRAIEDFGQICE